MGTPKFFISIMIFVSLTGCSTLLTDRTFLSEMEGQQDGFFKPGDDFPVISGDWGAQGRSKEEIMARTPASSFEREERDSQSALSNELMKKETALGEEEMMQYKKFEKALPSVSDKLYFLGLSPAEKNYYMAVRQGRSVASVVLPQPLIQKALLNREILRGMSKKDVLQIWGDPTDRAFAGNQKNENERWTFNRNGRMDYLYFESGVVQGWELH